MKTGIELIAEERQRQIEEEGWGDSHDDEHTDGSLADAAVCYAATGPIFEQRNYYNQVSFSDPWPWDDEWDKREDGTRIRNLQKAGALIAAEIDRLNRLELTSAEAQKEKTND
jgi:hypothetical protein